MRITGLTVDGFGVWSELDLGDLGGELTVFYGPNEAGKTTLMQFVRSVFFGFSPERRSRYLPPLRRGRPGGQVRVLVGEADCTITRHAEGPQRDELVVARGSRRAVDGEKTLAGLLGGVDEPTFNNVFVCGLREIQELATLGDTQAAEELYNLALGLDRVSLVDVLRELGASRERLLATDDRPSLVPQLIGQRDRLRAEIEELQAATPRYLTLAAERRHLEKEIAALEADAARWDEQARALSLARNLAERWRKRSTLDEQLRAMGGVEAMPDDALARLDHLQQGIQVLGKRLRRLKHERDELRGQLGAFPINEALCRQALRLEALAEQQNWIASLEKQITELEAEIARIAAACEQGRAQWALATPDRAGQLSKRELGALREAARAWRAARGEARERHRQVASAAGQSSEVARRLDDALGAAKDKGLTAALAEAGQLVAELRKRIHLDERISQLAGRETELEGQSHDRLEEQMLPTWALAGLGALFVLGCALVLLFFAGMVLPASLGDSLTWPYGAVGLAAIGLAIAGKFGWERAAERRLEQCHQQIELLGEQIAAAKAERDELDARLPRGGGPLAARLQAAEKSLARLEDLVPLETEREAAQRAAEAAQRETAALDDRARAARKRWRSLLAEHGLPPDLQPSQLKAFARGRREVAGLSAALADKQAELGRLRGQYEGLAARLNQLVSQTGVAPRSGRPLEQLQQCLNELGLQQSLVKQRAEVQRQLRRLRVRYRKTRAKRQRLRERRVQLLRAGGTLDEAEFRRRAALAADAARLRVEHGELEREIAALLAPDPLRERITAWLASGENLEVADSQLNDKRRALAARLSEAHEHRGELNEQLKRLAEDRTLLDKRQTLDALESRLKDASRRWQVLAACGLLLDSVRDLYEREHQPQALQEASGYLRRLTGNRYQRVWTPLGEHALRVDDAEGRSLPVEVLSSGTREQLFLALRLALASSYARRGIELPLVLDDVLVNFDVARAKAAAVVLRDFARCGHQVLLFTCHEHIARLFRNVRAEVRVLPDHASGNAAGQWPWRRRAEEESADLPPVEIPQPVPPASEVEAELPPPPAKEPPPPAPPPARRPRRRAIARAEQVRWSAEEFEGELSDRVRRDLVEEVDEDDSAAA